jgi:putative membrane-bound dehydrogenase-like protein
MTRLAFLCLLALPWTLSADDGVLPVGADGKPLNLDFETGTLKDWTATGDAFRDQPIRGDTVTRRRGDMKSRHQGEFWVGGYERFGDKPVGTLTSVPFKVTHRWASFLVGGGPWNETCIELLAGDEVFHRASGSEKEDMEREVIDLIKYTGKEIRIRLVDKNTGHWGHINFDDFRFHSQRPKVPARPKKVVAGPMDNYKNAGLSPEKAAAAMTVPEDFTVTLFAGEPDVHQPVGFCIDDRGRLWVVECFTYPKRLPFPGPLLPEAEKKKGDRILIFEDTDGDGKFDKKTTFLEGLNLAVAIEIGFGGVWVGAAPYLLFIPDKNGDDKPDGPPQILLDGWDAVSDTHETLNTFCWGPDGWLYGCHGVFTRSRVGKPGTPDKDRVPINCGVWRYHPTKHVFEVFAHGTSNPWGLDYNEHGEFFIEACVIPHCFHIIQGARYLRQAGSHFNPYTYADIGTIADHLHYVGATPHGGNNRSDSAGGGHAHCGLMCYLGGTWPKKYHGQLFMGNIHGRRINMDILKPKGSGYVASHGPDFLLANDEWARFINLKYGPDGNVYLIDWYDKQACHRTETEIWDRTNGRIYKISYRGAKAVTGIDLQKCTDEELVKYQLHENEWYVRHARRILQERAAKDPKAAVELARQLVHLIPPNEEDLTPAQVLRKLWALHAVGNHAGADATLLHDSTPDVVRAWAVRLLLEDVQRFPDQRSRLTELPIRFPSAVVRREIASGLQRIPVIDRPAILTGVLSHEQDAADFNLPLLYWYALEPVVGVEPKTALQLAANAKIPMLLQFTARRIATTADKEQNGLLAEALAKTADGKNPDAALLILRGMNEGYRGRKDVPIPDGWSATADKLAKLEKSEVTSLTTTLSITFGDPKAFAAMRSTLSDPNASVPERQAAMSALVNGRDKELAPILHSLVTTPGLRGPAIRALAGYDDPKTPGVLLSHWKSLSTDEVRDALNTLASRPAYAHALLDALDAKKVQPAEVTADVVRAMRNLPDKALGDKITKVWGVVRDTPAERKKDITAWKRKLTLSGKDDLALGRAIYAKTCQQCHTLYGVGGKIGPDITGSNRANLDYLLENIFDPHAVIPKEYAQSVLNLNSGRTITGIVKGDNGVAYTVQTPNELLVINKGDVDEIRPSALSLMPDDQMKPFSDHEVRALFAYLRNPQQVPMLATADNAKDLFNGKDLSGWTGDPALWKVEDGEIVGKTTGLKKNEFLKSDLAAENFRLSLKVKLTPNAGNSGIQFRSEVLPNGDVKGPQADVGAGWWGKLYEEHGRGLLADKGGEEHVKPGEWNDYMIEAHEGNVRIAINGKVCTDYFQDDKLVRRGIFAFQLHSGGAQEVRFKDLRLEVIQRK